jgi:hypothetical protein
VTRRRVLFACVTVVPLALSVVMNGLMACTPSDCVARGSQSSFEGSATYSGQTSTAPHTSLAGASTASVVVYDVEQSCNYDGMEFMVTIGTCSLWLTLDESGDDGGDDGGPTGYASVEPGQSCELQLADFTVAMTVESGTLVIGTPIDLTLSGNVVAPLDGGTAPGYLQWSFNGQ